MINVRRMGRAALRCSVAVLVLVPAIASADAGAVTDPLTLAGAIALALERNPDLAASAYDLLAAEGCVTQSGVLPNPEFSVDLENFGTRTEERGEAALEATLGLSQVLELGGKRRGHVGVAMAERETAVLQHQAEQLDVFAEVTRRFIAGVAAQEQLDLQREAVSLAERIATAIGRRVEVARSPRAPRA